MSRRRPGRGTEPFWGGRGFPAYRGPEQVASAVFSADARRFVCALLPSGSVKVFDVASGRDLASVPSDEGLPSEMQFSPDGMRVAVSRQGWPALSRVAITPNLPPVRSVNAPAVEHSLCVYDVATGEPVFKRGLPEYGGGPLAFSPEGKLLVIATGEGSTTLEFLDASTGQLQRTISDLPSGSTALRFATDGKRLVCGCSDGTALVWEVDLR